MDQQYKDILLRYFPGQAVDQVMSVIKQHNVHLQITGDRSTKLGDFRPPRNRKPTIISINGGINKYTAYLVFIHEAAHLLVWKKYGRSVNPHGLEWKQEFSALLKQAVYKNMLPADLKEPVLRFSDNIKATFASAPELWKVLRTYDEKKNGHSTVEELDDNTVFMAANGKVFRKGSRLRKRYRCLCVNNQKQYLFHPFAEVEPIDEAILPDWLKS